MAFESEAKKFSAKFDSGGEMQNEEKDIVATAAPEKDEDGERAVHEQTINGADEKCDPKSDVVQNNHDEEGGKGNEREQGLGENSILIEKIQLISEELKRNTEVQSDLEKKVIQTLKENANFQIQVRQNMQKDIEEAKKKLSGDIFVPLLKEIAELYIEWQDVLADLEDGVAKRKVAGIFETLKEMLEENGCEFGVSEVNTKRRPKYSKLRDKVPTGEKECHETVAKSHNPWIVKEPFVLYPEYVDVFVYDLAFESDQAQEENFKDSKEITE